jgi:hypothetical protein
VETFADESAVAAHSLPALVHGLRYAVSERLTGSGDVGFASASEALALGRGDCTEHAALLAAIARAQGVPTRLAAGLIWQPAEEPTEEVRSNLIYHVWTQIALGGEWYDVDAAMEETETKAHRLALLHLDGSEELMELSVSLLRWMGEVEIEIVADPSGS